MRAFAAAAVAGLALLVASPMYMDDPGTGGTYGAFYVCTPDRCGWWFCWPTTGCYPI